MTNLIPYNKKYSSSADLVSLLSSRGLHIEDRHKTEHYIDNIGYYRLSAYMYPLLQMPKSAHIYKRGANFRQVIMLYRFDKKLRMLIFNEIEKIEVAVRRVVLQITADMTNDPFWLTNPVYFSSQRDFHNTFEIIKKEYEKSTEDFIVHFRNKYSDPYPPVWIFGELLTIGNVNAIYRNIKQDRIRKTISKRFGLQPKVLESWLTILAVTRNACAHHDRVWNKQNAILPAFPRHATGRWISLPTDPLRIYYDLCIIKYLLDVISPDNDFRSKLTWLFINFPGIDLRSLGFPQGWEMELLWA